MGAWRPPGNPDNGGILGFWIAYLRSQ